jgi:hypothetical protein
MAMPKQRQPWSIRPAKKRVTVPASIKTQLQRQANELVEDVLKPKHVLPQAPAEPFNYISDIEAKWYRGYFYFISTYTCPDPRATSTTFESKFARMEYLGDGTFALYFMRHTGEWVGIFDALSIEESMKAIQDESWFSP